MPCCHVVSVHLSVTIQYQYVSKWLNILSKVLYYLVAPAY